MGSKFKQKKKVHDWMRGKRVPFTGEMMNCERCGRMEKSFINLAAGWRCLMLDEHRIYICPDEVKREMTSEEWTEFYVETVRLFVTRTPGYKPAKSLVLWREHAGQITQENLN